MINLTQGFITLSIKALVNSISDSTSAYPCIHSKQYTVQCNFTPIVSFNKRYFIIDQLLARYLVHDSKCLSNPSSLLSISNNHAFSYFTDFCQSQQKILYIKSTNSAGFCALQWISCIPFIPSMHLKWLFLSLIQESLPIKTKDILW